MVEYWGLLAIESEMGCFVFFFQAEDGIRYLTVTGVQTCALPISVASRIFLQIEQRVADRIRRFPRFAGPCGAETDRRIRRHGHARVLQAPHAAARLPPSFPALLARANQPLRKPAGPRSSRKS